MKKVGMIFVNLSVLALASACVMTPSGHVVTSPDVSVEAELELGPRVQTGTRSSVTVWLHPSYVVNDADLVAERHCGRWGLWAVPVGYWSVRAQSARHLNYRCAGHTVYLGSPYVRRRRYGRRHNRSYWRRPPIVRTPEAPRRPIYKRPTYGSTRPIYNPPVYKSPVYNRPHYSRPAKEVGKPWEHNPGKKKIVQTTPVYPRPTYRNSAPKVKRRTFGRNRPVTVVETKKVTRKGRLRPKAPRKGTLSL